MSHNKERAKVCHNNIKNYMKPLGIVFSKNA